MQKFALRLAVCVCMAVSMASGADSTPCWDPINPYERETTVEETVSEWSFDDGRSGWRAVHSTEVEARAGRLHVTATGKDPYIHGPAIKATPRLHVDIRMKSNSSGAAQVFWTTPDGGWSQERMQTMQVQHDGKWHTYSAALPAEDTVTRLRLDPGMGEGTIVIDYIRLRHSELHPLEIRQLERKRDALMAHVKNHGDEKRRFTLAGNQYSVGPGKTVSAPVPTTADAPFERVTVKVQSPDLPPLRRTAYIHHPGADTNWLTLSGDKVQLKIAPDGSGARLLRGGRVVGVLTPLVAVNPLQRGRSVPELEVEARSDHSVTFSAPGLGELRLSVSGRRIFYSARTDSPVGGPVVRAVGHMQQGLLSGVEYLGEGERSSSRRDIRTPEHVRFAPERRDITMPLMAYVTDRARLSLTWNNMNLQPIFATPDFFDGTDDHLMGLAGREIDATLRVAPGWQDGGRLTDSILWAVRRMGVPEPPQPPRDLEEQWNLCLSAYRETLKADEGWHILKGKGEGKWYADYASVIWRLTGEMPETGGLVGGGCHLSLPESFLVAGQVQRWLRNLRNKAYGARRGQRDDGSWAYNGDLAKTHFENTASGLCALRAKPLLKHALYTGNDKSRDAAVRALEYIKRFRTPRGAQTWEIPLHTPDILASARLVNAYVTGYRLTGREDFLREARRWAITGLPFVYLWGDKPVMRYATIAVYGATHLQRPNWIGRPVQWCGTVYADALLALAPHDEALDWRKIARGITVAGEQMQYTEGPSKGTLPDSWLLESQEPRPWDIDPGALVSLRLRLEGRPAGVYTAVGGEHRVVAPYPVSIRDGEAIIEAEKGQTYRVVIDGHRVKKVDSQGRDAVPLD